jgi:hypothetical protein
MAKGIAKGMAKNGKLPQLFMRKHCRWGHPRHDSAPNPTRSKSEIQAI